VGYGLLEEMSLKDLEKNLVKVKEQTERLKQ
jgi:hypothetical protein